MIKGTDIHFWDKNGKEYRPIEIHILFKGMEERLAVTSSYWPKHKIKKKKESKK